MFNSRFRPFLGDADGQPAAACVHQVDVPAGAARIWLTDEANAVLFECRCQAISQYIVSKKRMEDDLETQFLEIERLAGTSLADRFVKATGGDRVWHRRRQDVEIHDRVE
jgi:hypothetical protein